MDQRDQRGPAGLEKRYERRWRDRGRRGVSRPPMRCKVATGGPGQESALQDQASLVLVYYECAIRNALVRGFVEPALAGAGVEPLPVELTVDRVSPESVGMNRRPDLSEPVVISAPALRARAMPGSQRRRLVEEEQLGVSPGRHQLCPTSVTEPKPAGNPSPGRVPPADLAMLVVQAAPVAVHEPPVGGGDQVAEGRYPVLERHTSQAKQARPPEVRWSHATLSRERWVNDPYGLERFVAAQDAHGTYEAAVAELRSGRKLSHWMWFVFPQIAGLGRSAVSRRYAISSLAEARAYLAHPVLGPRLIECADVLSKLHETSAQEIFGVIDAMKLRSSMTLFARTDPANPSFRRVLDAYFAGVPDEATERLLEPAG
jgi:uncharacterized protein (DUF1810 family)